MKDLNNNGNYHSNGIGAFRLPRLEASTSSLIRSLAVSSGRHTPGPRLTRSQISSLLEAALAILSEMDDDETSQGTSSSSQSGNCSRDKHN
jgi:hypothetical protein